LGGWSVLDVFPVSKKPQNSASDLLVLKQRIEQLKNNVFKIKNATTTKSKFNNYFFIKTKNKLFSKNGLRFDVKKIRSDLLNKNKNKQIQILNIKQLDLKKILSKKIRPTLNKKSIKFANLKNFTVKTTKKTFITPLKLKTLGQKNKLKGFNAAFEKNVNLKKYIKLPKQFLKIKKTTALNKIQTT